MADKNHTDRLLDVNEAAAMLGLKPCTLYQWAYERRIPVVKLFSRALRFKRSTIEKLIADSERPALRPLNDRPRSQPASKKDVNADER
ncbi:MAG: helix-turn-helix transcriptional regulator [Candidatus Binatia bacterium]